MMPGHDRRDRRDRLDSASVTNQRRLASITVTVAAVVVIALIVTAIVIFR